MIDTTLIINFIRELFSLQTRLPLLFTSFYFWAFFALVFAGIALFGSKVLLRNTFLMFCGLFFYFKTSGFFVLVLIFAILLNYLCAKAITVARTERGGKVRLIIGLVVNILLLCYFKYSYFVIDVINSLLGIQLQVVDVFAEIGNVIVGNMRFDVGKIVLPVGISFFTFQNISYIVEVYRRKVQPISSLLNYGFFVSFFPSLMSGPIIRADEFIPQIYKPYFLTKKQFGIAVFWILNGLIKKIILSDYLAVNFVDRIFENPTMFSGFENLMGLFGYSLQIYADFSGYTDIATGVAMLMGFYLPINFNSPYKAVNAGQFWKRWHISLSRWLQNYLYIPLGGNRNATFGSYCIMITISIIAMLLAGNIYVSAAIALVVTVSLLFVRFQRERRQKIITNLNMMNTMLLGGLWHGASWNFIIWGGLNGIGMLVYKFWRNRNIYVKSLLLTVAAALAGVWLRYSGYPIAKIAFVWLAVLWCGTFVKLIYNITKLAIGSSEPHGKVLTWLSTAWAVLQTFVFITFTRLFFRSGSNLDPSEANSQAWATAKNMVGQIGGVWHFDVIPNMLWGYRNVFIIFVIGMILHWLPEHFKRRYRLWFAQMPVWTIAVVVVFTVFVLYQFITADLQKFIYFQF